jgi:hypothetical protein
VKIIEKVHAAKMKEQGKQVLRAVLARASGMRPEHSRRTLACAGSGARSKPVRLKHSASWRRDRTGQGFGQRPSVTKTETSARELETDQAGAAQQKRRHRR